MDIVKVDALAWQKNSKRLFLKDIENSFHQVTHIQLRAKQTTPLVNKHYENEVTYIGLESHQFFSF